MTFTRSLLACAAACALLSAAPVFSSAAFAGDKSGVDQTSFDKSVAPGGDFWAYANGEWIKTHPIPPTAAPTARARSWSRRPPSGPST